MNHHKELVELLLLNGADSESLDDEGCTAIYYGAEKGHEVIVKTLIDYGAKVNGASL